MNNKPKISIIIPVYNVEKYLAKCIDSVLAQTFADFECILVDDGSPDNSPAICDEYAKKDARVKVIHKENGGLSDARNAGMKIASGDYLLFVDGDDWVEPNLVEDSLTKAIDFSADIVTFGYYVDDLDNSEKIIDSIKKVPNTGDYHREIFDKINVHYQLLGILGYAWNKLYRKEFIDKNGVLFEKGTSLIEDILFNSKAFSNAERISFIPQSYLHYIKRPRLTLGNMYYPDFFEKKKRAYHAVKSILDIWRIDGIRSTELLKRLNFDMLKEITKKIVKADNINTNSKKIKLRDIFNDDINMRLFQSFTPDSLKDKAIFFLMKRRFLGLLMKFYEFSRKMEVSA